MFNAKKNKTFITVVVWVLTIGIVAAYAPLLFTSPQVVREDSQSKPALGAEEMKRRKEALALLEKIKAEQASSSSSSVPISNVPSSTISTSSLSK